MFKHKPLNFKFMTGVAAATIGAFILVPIATSIDATSLLGIDAAKAGQGSGGGSGGGGSGGGGSGGGSGGGGSGGGGSGGGSGGGGSGGGHSDGGSSAGHEDGGSSAGHEDGGHEDGETEEGKRKKKVGKSGAASGGSTDKGKKGSASSSKGGSSAKAGKSLRAPVSSAEDSDRPVWAGVKGGKAGGGGKPPGAGSKKGDLYGDMVVLLRDDNGEPLLTEDGLLQVAAFVYDEEGNLVPLLVDGKLVYIPYNEEGDLVTTIKIDGEDVAVYSGEVDLGRLSVSRSPTKVLDKSLVDALTTLSTGTIGLDATGRLTVTVDGVTSTIDSPLSNLALYDAIMSGTIIPGTAYTKDGVTVTLPTDLSTAALFAAAADKTSSITVDTVVYMNSILGINDLPENYYDFDSVDYDRSTTWENVTVEVLVLQADGVTYKVEPVNVYDTVFTATEWTDFDGWWGGRLRTGCGRLPAGARVRSRQRGSLTKHRASASHTVT